MWTVAIAIKAEAHNGPNFFFTRALSMNLEDWGLMLKVDVFVKVLDHFIFLYRYASKFYVTFCFHIHFIIKKAAREGRGVVDQHQEVIVYLCFHRNKLLIL